MFHFAAGYLMAETIAKETLLNVQDEPGNYFEKECHQVFAFLLHLHFQNTF